MFDAFYYVFRSYGLEGLLQFAILSYVLFILCDAKKPSMKSWHYVALSSMVYAILQWTVRFFLPDSYYTIINTHEVPYWFTMISSILLQFLCAHVLLNNSIPYKMTYILFFMAFVQLFKVVCSPLYEAESLMPPDIYRLLDVGSVLLLCLLLILLTFLFRRYKIYSSIRIPENSILFALYFPISILVCYSLSSNSHAIYRYSTPLIALIILSDLPMIYYILSVITRSYEEQRRLDDALIQTKAQLARFRFSIELQEQLKKERHELKNNYFYIQTLLKEKKYDQLNHYMENVVGEKLSNLNEIETGNILMDYLLNRKVQEAHRHQIKTYVEVLVPSQLNVSEDTLCTILLNLLDNAIEASLKENSPDIHISINCVQNYLVCKISNKVSENILSENPQLVTTKKDSRNHGLGLKIIRQTVQKCNGILQLTTEKGYFIATVMLPIS